MKSQSGGLYPHPPLSYHWIRPIDLNISYILQCSFTRTWRIVQFVTPIVLTGMAWSRYLIELYWKQAVSYRRNVLPRSIAAWKLVVNIANCTHQSNTSQAAIAETMCVLAQLSHTPHCFRGCTLCLWIALGDSSLVMNIHNPSVHCVTSQNALKSRDVIMLLHAVTLVAA